MSAIGNQAGSGWIEGQSVGGEGSTRVGPPPRVGSSVRGNSHTEEGKESTTWQSAKN